MAELRRRTGVPLAAGQNEALAFRFRDMLRDEAIDYAQPNVMIGGGFTQCVKIAGMAEAFNVSIDYGGAGAAEHALQAGVANGVTGRAPYVAVALNRKIYRRMPKPTKG